MFKNASNDDYAEFPRLADRIDEDPGRWLDSTVGLTPTVDSLIRGIEDLERALNWRYVARACDCDGAVRDRIDQRIARLRRRPAAKRMAPALRELFQAAPTERPQIRDRALEGADVDGTDAKVIAALCATLPTTAVSETNTNAGDGPATGSDPTHPAATGTDTTASETEQEPDTKTETETGRRQDIPLKQARDLAASMERDRVNSLLQLEQAADDPRENVLTALTERREELTNTGVEVANA